MSRSRWLVRYGLFLMCVGVLAVMYDPKSGQVGFNSAAKTALLSGGVCGGISIACGLLLGRGFQRARPAAMIFCALFLAAFTWRATAGWVAFAGGQTEKWFASTLIVSMWVATLAMLALLLRSRRTGAPLNSGAEPNQTGGHSVG